jgi:hypothetical protein
MSSCRRNRRSRRLRTGPRRRGPSCREADRRGAMSRVFDRPPQAELSGVRLGALERTLLMAAPPLGTLGGLLIEAPDGTRSAQQGYLRAARKLEHVLLVECARVQRAVRAHDPRRERPVYRRGRFWRVNPTRRQIVRRVVVWVTAPGRGHSPCLRARTLRRATDSVDQGPDQTRGALRVAAPAQPCRALRRRRRASRTSS